MVYEWYILVEETLDKLTSIDPPEYILRSQAIKEKGNKVICRNQTSNLHKISRKTACTEHVCFELSTESAPFT